MHKFEEGQLYKMFLITDSQSVIIFRVIKRTLKTVTVSQIWPDVNSADTKSCRINPSADNGFTESIKPWGSYSMAPTLTAKRQVDTNFLKQISGVLVNQNQQRKDNAFEKLE